MDQRYLAMHEHIRKKICARISQKNFVEISKGILDGILEAILERVSVEILGATPGGISGQIHEISVGFLGGFSEDILSGFLEGT